MTLKILLLALALILAGFSRLSAEGLSTQDIVIEPPAPSSYSEERPAYMFFKKIEISPRSSGSYDITITLQEALPSTFPKDRGADFNLDFDFDEISPELSLPTNRIPNFHLDFFMPISRPIRGTKFDANPATIEYHKRKWDIKFTNLTVRKDTITFNLRSPLFALHPAFKVIFRSNYMKATSPTQSSGPLTQETAPISLNSPAASSPQ